MFDFEKLNVYQKAKQFDKSLHPLCLDKTIDCIIANQLKRAALSIALNSAEVTSRHSKAYRRNFYINNNFGISEFFYLNINQSLMENVLL